MKARRAWTDVIQTLREYKCQPRLLHPAKLSIAVDGETKVLHNRTKFTHYLSTNPALQRIITEKKNTKKHTFCCLQETHLREKNRHYLRMKGWKTISQANGLKKQAGVAILISNKIDLQPKVVKKDKEGHFILIKGKILQE
jgi:exonuclease III